MRLEFPLLRRGAIRRWDLSSMWRSHRINSRQPVTSSPTAPHIAFVQGDTRPEYDGVADYVRHLTAALLKEGVGVETVLLEGSVRGLGHTIRRLWTAQPDVVHLQFAPSAYRFSGLPGLLPLLLPQGMPLVTTLHEYGWWATPKWIPNRAWQTLENHRIWDRESGRLVLNSAATLVTNPAHGEMLTRRLGVRPISIPLAPNVSKPRRAQGPAADLRRQLGISLEFTLLVFFGFVHPVKGLRYLIEALATLRTRYPQLHLLIIGGFTSQALPEAEAQDFRKGLEGWIHHCQVADLVTITEYLPDEEVSRRLHAADVAVFPFTVGATTKSGALLSAFAHQLPTAVTTTEPPDRELVDGETVVAIPKRRNAAALADALHRLLSDEGLRHRIAAGGAAIAAKRSWSQVAATHHEIYNQVLSTNHALH